jgi:hypothetical protein
MNFYNNTHPYYCGIDLHARTLYVCILDQDGKILVHKEITEDPEQLHRLLEPYIGNIVVGVECMHYWYWAAAHQNGAADTSRRYWYLFQQMTLMKSLTTIAKMANRAEA